MAAAPYRDIIDALMHLRGHTAWTWRDSCGHVSPGRGLLRCAVGLARDAAALPVLLAKHTWAARRCIRDGRRLLPADISAGGLYLRMDHLFDLQSGGSVAHTAGVINAMREMVPRLTVLSTDRLALVPEDENFHVLTPSYDLGGNVPLLPNLTYTSDVIRWWRAAHLPRPGFIYGRYSLGNYAGPELRRLLKVPYVCEYNGSAIWITRNWGDGRLRFERVLQTIEDANLLAADVIIAVSEASRAELIERGYPADRILVNPNGVDPEIYAPGVSGAEVRARAGIATDEIVIGFIGTFGRWHGTQTLATAFGLLLQHRPDLRSRVRLLLVGEGPMMEETRRILAHHEAADRVIFTGLVPQAQGPAHLAACDILASPHVANGDNSRFFGSPTKLFEYMAMGRAIVASDLEQVGEVLSHNETAWLVRPGDPQALAKALEALISSAGLRDRLGRAARKQAVSQHTWHQHTRRIVERLEQLNAAVGRK